MALTVQLTPEEEARLEAAARSEGIAIEECVRRLIAVHLPRVAPGDPTQALLAAGETIRQRVDDAIAFLQEELQEDEVPPTQDAVDACRRMLASASERLPVDRPFPFPLVTTNGRGNLVCEWRAPVRTVIVAVSPDGKAVLHRYESRPDSGVARAAKVSPPEDEIAEAIRWFATQNG